MIAAFTLCMLVAQPTIPPLADPPQNVDPRIRRLYDPAVRNDRQRLAAALDDIWKMLPEPDPDDRLRQEMVAKYIVPFITVHAPNVTVPKDFVRPADDTQHSVYRTLVRIGPPAVPALLLELSRPYDPKKYRTHRETVARCLVEIYDKGGEGQQMAAERIRLYAETQPPDRKERVLAALELYALKPQPPKPGK